MTRCKGGIAGFMSDQNRNPAITARPVVQMSTPAKVVAISHGRADGGARTLDDWNIAIGEAIPFYARLLFNMPGVDELLRTSAVAILRPAPVACCPSRDRDNLPDSHTTA